MVYSSGADITEFIGYAFDSYKKIFVSDKNLVFSPLAFRIVHSVLYQCAQDDVELVLAQNLFKNADVIDKSDIQNAQLINFNRLAENTNCMHVIAKFFLTPYQEPTEKLIRTLKQFNVRWKQVKFQKKREKFEKYLNKWIVRKSNGKLTSLVDMNYIFDVTSMLVVTSLYFKSPWKTPFTKDSVRTINFTNFNGELIPTPFISDEDNYRLSSDGGFFDVLEMPYGLQTQLRLWIMLPKQPEMSIFDLKEKLNLNCLQQINENFQSHATRIQIPVFNVTSEINGRHIIPELYNSGNLNVYEKPVQEDEIDGMDMSYLNEIRQKMVFGVNTNGTEESDVGIVRNISVSGFHGMKSFRANRPFIYLVLTADKFEPIIVGHFVDAK